ncbi:hypothetical protein PV772_08760 [Pseudarthrobacter sp. CC12]|uniref:hypothetical protein n=1 Tax=Pseudarthrobacter sp. CC12 TaxID=3029193 RepID=UPI003262FFE2
MFITAAHQYDRNVSDAANFTAAPAELGIPGGAREPGVVLRNGKSIKAVMPVSEALRLAHQIADALASHKARAGQQPTSGRETN